MSNCEDPNGPFPVLTDEEKEELRKEWADYVPEPIVISEARMQELRKEHDRYVAELIEEVGEPSPEEVARAEAWWRPIKEHLMKNGNP